MVVHAILVWLHLGFVKASPLLDFLAVDLAAYDRWARQIAAGDWIGSAVFYQDPLYPYLLAVSYRLLTPSVIWVLLLQALASVATVWLLFVLGRELFGPGRGLLAAWAWALYGPAIYYAAMPEKAALAGFGFTLVASLALSASRKPSWGRFLAAGAACGATSLLRSNLLLLAGLLVLLLLATETLVVGRRRRWVGAAIFGMGLALVLLPVALRNRVVGGAWVLTTSQAGANLYIGNHPGNRTGSYDTPDFIRPSPVYEREDFRRHAEAATGRMLTPSEVSSFYVREVLRWAREDPSAFLRLQLRKTRIFVQAWEIPDNWSYEFLQRYSPILSLPWLSWALIAPWGLLGLLFGIRDRAPGVRAISLLVLAYSASVVAFFVFSRYRFPVASLVAVFAAHGLLTFLECLRRRRWRQAGLALLVLLPATWAVYSRPAVDPSRDLGHRFVNLASSLVAAGRLQEAEALLEDAGAATSPDSGLWLARAGLAARRGDEEGEGAALQRALELAPGHPQILARSVDYLARTAGSEAAAAFARDQLGRRESYAVRRAYAELSLREGRPAELERRLRELLERFPGDPWGLEQRFGLAVHFRRWSEARETATDLARRTGQRDWWLRAALAANAAGERELARELARQGGAAGESLEELGLEDPFAGATAPLDPVEPSPQ